MEKCVDSDFTLLENDVCKTSNVETCNEKSQLSNDPEEKDKSKDCCKVSKIHEKIASEELSSSPVDQHHHHLTGDGAEKTGRHLHHHHHHHHDHNETRTKSNVLNKHLTETARQSVQKKTKIIKSNVPDRLGKYVSYRVRSKTKLLLDECKLDKRPPERCPEEEEERETSGKPSDSIEAATETKRAVLGNECLINEEADRLRNRFESDTETRNIFEKFFDDCLDSTSSGKDASSHVNKEERRGVTEITPEKKAADETETETESGKAPVKNKDHSNYYSSHKNIRHVCAYCHKIFKNNGKLNSHVYSHTGERPFDCHHCGKAFSSKFKLVRHLLIHSEVRKFVCQICDRTFLRNDHLKNHYKVHDPQKKMYKCPKENCDKEYSSVMSHKKHMAYHNVEDGDLKCLICQVKYETKEEILFHLKSHSGSRLFKSQSDKKFKCQFCERLFLTRKDVTRHLVVHTGERDFLCQFCPQRFGRKDHLVRHIKKSHSQDEDPRAEETKAEVKKREEGTRERPSSGEATFKENNTQTEDEKTRIVITVQGKTLQNRGKRKIQRKPFQKSEMLVPKNKKKQVPLAKSPTTQILLQNIPNILIIPNSSIILVRNQKKSPEESRAPEPLPPSAPLPQTSQVLTPPPPPTPADFNFYDPNLFPAPSPYLGAFHDSDSGFSNFQPDMPSFGSQFDEPDFEMLGSGDLLPRPGPEGSFGDGNFLGSGGAPGKPEGFAGGGSDDGLTLNEAILNESPAVLPEDPGILGNLLNQTSDNCGFELLRHLLTSENPVLSPLPGFSQIFHNSNTNTN